MKRFHVITGAVLLAVLTAVIGFLIGCQMRLPEIEETDDVLPAAVTEGEAIEAVEEIPEEPEETEPEWSDSRIVAVMIDNDNNDSRPHAGIEDAFMIYEMYVEGTSTRLMALFKDADTEKIGPIRSCRHYFLDYVMDNDAIYIHCGQSPKGASDLKAYKINNLNGLYYENVAFWRERKFKGDWHSLYSSIGKISETTKNTLKYRMESTERAFDYYFPARDFSQEGTSATHLKLPYASFYSVDYRYDETTGLYDRYINNSPHTTQGGVDLKARQIVVQFCKSYPIAGDTSNRIELVTVGSGEGLYLSDGRCMPITWRRDARDSKLRCYFENGEEIKLNYGGQTYFNVIPPTMKYTLE